MTSASFSSVADQLARQAIELPSWAFGNSGTRFKVFGTPGTPRTVEEKIADAAAVHRFTGLAPTVALHIPWDEVDDYAALSSYAKEQGVALGRFRRQIRGQEIGALRRAAAHPHGGGGGHAHRLRSTSAPCR